MNSWTLRSAVPRHRLQPTYGLHPATMRAIRHIWRQTHGFSYQTAREQQ